MNIKDLLPNDQAVAIKVLFRSDQAAATVIQILAGKQLQSHMTKIPALLICVLGDAVFENKKGVKETLQTGDFVQIEPLVKHWVNAVTNSQLILFK